MESNARRHFLESAASSAMLCLANRRESPFYLLFRQSINSTDIRIENITVGYEEHRYRAPYKFGGVPVDRATILNVTATVRTRSGKLVKGFGSMPLGNVWSFPSREMPYNTTLGAMKALAERLAKITNEYREYGHSIEINFQL